jgi:hypothetical protein
MVMARPLVQSMSVPNPNPTIQTAGKRYEALDATQARVLRAIG